MIWKMENDLRKYGKNTTPGVYMNEIDIENKDSGERYYNYGDSEFERPPYRSVYHHFFLSTEDGFYILDENGKFIQL